MPLTNHERAELIRGSLCSPAAAFDEITNLRKALKQSLEGAPFSSASVCDTLAPLPDRFGGKTKQFTEEKRNIIGELADAIDANSGWGDVDDLWNLHQMALI